MQPSQKVAFNTIILYIRAFVTIGITLYTTRLVLEVLGVEDFGLYNLISGVIGLLSILNVAMSVSSQRYLSYYQGKNDINKQKSIFVASLVLHLVIAILFLMVLQVAGLFLFDGFLNIASERIGASRISYQMMLVSVIFSILSVPFTASINAHEQMGVMALVNILEAVLRLASAFTLILLSTGDRLVWFSMFNALVGGASFILYAIYCLAKYPECTLRLRKLVTKKDIRELSGFAGWNLMGSLCGMGRAQGISLLLNLFLGVTLNAAYAIACQLGNYVSFFSATILQTFNPQIMKSEGSGDRGRMLRLAMTTSKMAFFLFAFLAIPCIFEMKGILTFWLKEIPSYTLVFSILLITGTLVNQLTVGLQSAIQATGNIKIYQLVIGSTILLNLPIAWFLLKNGYSPYWIFIAYVLIEGIACSMRLYFMRIQAGLSIREYVRKVFAREIIPVLVCIVVCVLVTTQVEMNYRFLLTFTLSVPVFALTAYFFGLCVPERVMINQIVESAFNKFKKQSFK